MPTDARVICPIGGCRARPFGGIRRARCPKSGQAKRRREEPADARRGRDDGEKAERARRDGRRTRRLGRRRRGAWRCCRSPTARRCLIVVGLKPITAGLGTIREMTSLAAALTWVGTGLGGILMGWLADRIGIRRIVIFGAAMIAAGLAVSAIGTIWALYHRARAAARPARQRRDVSAAARLCQPLVRAAARHRAGADRVGPIHRRHGLADRVRARDGALWLAGDDDRLRRGLPIVADPAGRGAVPAPAARRNRIRRDAAAANASAARRWACRPIWCWRCSCIAGFCCCVPMALPQSHLVAFCSDIGIPRGARRGDAVGDDGLRLCQPAVLGLARRPGRRAVDADAGLGLPGAGDRRVSVDPERGRAVRGVGRVRARVQRHRAGLCADRARAVPVVRGVVAGADRALRQR